MVYSLVVRACGLVYGGREFDPRSLHLKPETQLREERGLSGCRKGLKTVPLAQALLSLKSAKTNNYFELKAVNFYTLVTGDGSWRSWSPWSTCPVNCDVHGDLRTGIHNRSRACISNDLSIAKIGLICPGDEHEEEECQLCSKDL